MTPREKLAIIGSGPSSIYLLKHLLDEAKLLRHHLREISVFEKSTLTGVGMPYSPQTTDRHNLANISSEELPPLPLSLADWLRTLSPDDLHSLDLSPDDISESKIYPRLVLGQYLNAQYRTITAGLTKHGITIHEHPGCQIADVQDDAGADTVTLVTASGENHVFQQVIIATGHQWVDEDTPEQGLYASPWPIAKLVPEEGEHHDLPVGTLGASLSAFDVVASLAHRHGEFTPDGDGLIYQPAPGTENFKIIMHASKGMLPHLQFDLEDLTREIYRHVSREELLGLIGGDGYLRIETYFDKVCRPAMITAFREDDMPDMLELISDPGFALKDFVEKMSDSHDYEDAFEGMRSEMVEARESVLHHKPIHWKETIDDLIYTLNFHAELMPAEDHLTLRSLVMPFLMNVIAAMPLESASKLLALHDAGKLDMISGNVTIPDEQPEEGKTTITVTDDDGEEATHTYRMFVDCSGQKPLDLVDYPFSSLVATGTARKARAPFLDPGTPPDSLPEKLQEHLFHDRGQLVYHIGGVDIDGTYRLIGDDGTPNPRIHDIAFPHTSGVRPYSYGLQACSDTGAILVRAWTQELQTAIPIPPDPVEITRIYEEV